MRKGVKTVAEIPVTCCHVILCKIYIINQFFVCVNTKQTSTKCIMFFYDPDQTYHMTRKSSLSILSLLWVHLLTLCPVIV